MPLHRSHAEFMADLILRHGMTPESRAARKLGAAIVHTVRFTLHPHVLNEGLEQWTTPE